MLQTGHRAPDFNLPSTTGQQVSLLSLRGKKVVLYFYPRDGTPGCTQQACDFRDNLTRLSGRGAVVLGVSKDSLNSHQRFREKYSLPFELLFDENNEVATAYGAFGEKNFYGKKIQGTIRSTFLIDEAGLIKEIWSKVKVRGHVDAVLVALGGAHAQSPAAALHAIASASPPNINDVAKPTSGTKKKKVAKKPSPKAKLRGAVGVRR